MTPGPAPQHWFEPLADYLGESYLRYSFTKGTDQEVGFLVDALDLVPGTRVLDVGCGPGRHAHLLADRGMRVVGVDISQRFIDLANAVKPEQAEFHRMDARELPFDQEFDAVISLCQGAFGLCGTTALDDDGAVLAAMARAVIPGGIVALSAFSAYFQLRFLEPTDDFDANAGINHERSTLHDESGATAEFDAWTTCFTPRELRLLARQTGLEVEHVWSVTPGAYGKNDPDVDQPEFFLLARRPRVASAGR